MNIGVLALQGGVSEHINHIKKLGHTAIEVKDVSSLTNIQGLILPGGESTTMIKLLKDMDLLTPLKTLIANGLPVWGTCAGMILLAKNIEGYDSNHIGLMDISVRRNAYGRQLGKLETHQIINEISTDSTIHMVFIRAPYITEILNQDVKILCKVNNEIVAASQKNMLVTSFHPELTDDIKFLEYFIEQFCK